MDLIVTLYQRGLSVNNVVLSAMPSSICLVFQHTTETSLLRKFLLDSLVRSVVPSWIAEKMPGGLEMPSEIPPEFFREMMVLGLNRATEGTAARGPSMKNICQYHERPEKEEGFVFKKSK